MSLPNSLRGDRKIILSASRILEEANAALNFSNNVDSQNASLFQGSGNSESLKDLAILRTELQQLLFKRQKLVMKRTRETLVSDTESLIQEYQNLETVDPWFSPDDRCFTAAAYKALPEKSFQITQHWLTLEQSHHRAILLGPTNGFNIELVHSSFKTRYISRSLLKQLTYLTGFHLIEQFDQLSQLDPEHLTPNFISGLLETCSVFNNFRLHLDKTNTSLCCRANSLEAPDNLPRTVGHEQMLIALANYQGCVAADQIARAILPDTLQKAKHNVGAQNWQNSRLFNAFAVSNEQGATSDYSSASFSDTDVLCEGPSKDSKSENADSLNLLNSISAAIRKNEVLLLKHRFAVESANAKPKQASESHAQRDSFLEKRKVWDSSSLLQPAVQACDSLEKVYWSCFWERTKMSLIQFIVDTPTYYCSEILPGTSILWNEDLVTVLMKALKASFEGDCMSSDAIMCLKNVFFHLFTSASLTAWNKGFCSLLKFGTVLQCLPVPVASGDLGTKPRIFFCSSLRPLFAAFRCFCTNSVELTYILKVLCCLLTSVHSFEQWYLTKERCLLSSLNTPASLVFIHCDIMHVQKLLQSNFSSDFCEYPLHQFTTFESCCLTNLHSELLNAVNELKACSWELPALLCKKLRGVIRSSLYQARVRKLRLQLCGRSLTTNSYEPIQHIIESTLRPIYEATFSIHVQNSQQWTIFDESVSAVARLYRDLLEIKNISIYQSTKLHGDVNFFISWLEELLIENDGQTQELCLKLREHKSSLTNKLLEMSQTSRRTISRTNKVAPEA